MLIIIYQNDISILQKEISILTKVTVPEAGSKPMKTHQNITTGKSEAL